MVTPDSKRAKTDSNKLKMSIFKDQDIVGVCKRRRSKEEAQKVIEKAKKVVVRKLGPELKVIPDSQDSYYLEIENSALVHMQQVTRTSLQKISSPDKNEKTGDETMIQEITKLRQEFEKMKTDFASLQTNVSSLAVFTEDSAYYLLRSFADYVLHCVYGAAGKLHLITPDRILWLKGVDFEKWIGDHIGLPINMRGFGTLTVKEPHVEICRKLRAFSSTASHTKCHQFTGVKVALALYRDDIRVLLSQQDMSIPEWTALFKDVCGSSVKAVHRDWKNNNISSQLSSVIVVPEAPHAPHVPQAP